MSQNITSEPRTDAGKKGTPAKESRQKLLMTGVSDVPSSPDRERSAVERFRARNQTQVPNEARGSSGSCGRREGREEDEESVDKMDKGDEDEKAGGSDANVSKQINTQQEEPRQKTKGKGARRDLDIRAWGKHSHNSTKNKTQGSTRGTIQNPRNGDEKESVRPHLE